MCKYKKEKSLKITEEDRLPGVVYICHVPHGFYERQLSSYFSQFGKVLSVKLSRSKKNGKTKGYAFVKFKDSAVAKTVADACHNYLFFNKLLNCEYKPMPEVHENTFFKFKWRPTTKRQHNSAKTTEKLDESVESPRRSARNQTKKLEKLKEFRIDLKLEDIMAVPKIQPKQLKKKSKEAPTPKE
ncbi:uncharacterized protein LOC131928060 [Physella acuta]|uniref:uncharacterized protein LOC131928060 n=1 Tax=Physella acuta TaxID=109671 RepID=UPI0027DB8F00|nr:uncharacterized protein LOC131928060 [Physella acuta]